MSLIDNVVIADEICSDSYRSAVDGWTFFKTNDVRKAVKEIKEKIIMLCLDARKVLGEEYTMPCSFNQPCWVCKKYLKEIDGVFGDLED